MGVTRSAHKFALNQYAVAGYRLRNDTQPGALASAGLLAVELVTCLGRPRRGDRRRNLAGPGGAGGPRRGSTLLDGPGSARAAHAVRVHPRRVVLVVVMVTAAMVPQGHPGEEDDGDDEDDPCDDGYPCRGNEDLGDLVWRWSCRRRRCSCGRSPRSGVFRRFTHNRDDAGNNNSCGYALLM